MKKNQLKIGAVMSYAQMFLSIIISLTYTPIMLRLLGKNEYGLYNTVSSTISMLSVLSLGFNSSYIRFFSRYKRDNDKESIYKLNGLFLIIFIIIGCIAAICGAYLSFHLDLVFDQGLTLEEYQIAKILMLLLTINLAISFPMSVFSNIISANEQYIFLRCVSLLKIVVSPLVTLPLLLMGYRSIAMVLVTLGISLIADTFYVWYVLKKLRNRFVFCNFEKGLFKNLFVFTSFIAINIVVDQINWNVDKILLGRFLGTEAVAVYSVGYTLYTYFQILSTSISGVFSPRIHRIVNTVRDRVEKKNQLTELMIKVGRVQFLILALVASGFVFFGKPFIMNIWAGAEYEESYYVALLLIIPALIPLIQNIGIEIQRAENLHQFRSLCYLVMAIINVVLSIYLCQRLGAVGSALGTAVSLVLANGVIINIYYHKCCSINIIRFWKEIVRLACGLIIPCVMGILIVKNMKLDSSIQLVLGICIYTVIYIVSMWMFGMNKYEKNLIRNPLMKVMRKK